MAAQYLPGAVLRTRDLFMRARQIPSPSRGLKLPVGKEGTGQVAPGEQELRGGTRSASRFRASLPSKIHGLESDVKWVLNAVCAVAEWVHSLSRVRLFATPWAASRQASLSITNSLSLLKLMSIKSVMTSSHLILCRPLLLLPSIFPRIRVFSNESAHQVARVLEFQLQHQSFQWLFRTDFL